VRPGDLFRMLEYAYGLKGFRLLDDSYEADSLQGFYDRLAEILARRILIRERAGLYREYLGRRGPLPYVRGRLDAPKMARRPWSPEPWCRYRESTADIEDNRILAWTTFLVGRSGALRDRTARLVRRAHHALHAAVTVWPIGPEACEQRAYNRLNADYEPLHALCRFFLEHTGPATAAGDREMLPFLVDTARLYEKFVSGWLAEHLPEGLRATPQEKVHIGGSLRFDIDLVLYDADKGLPLCVLDTKYKDPSAPEAGDVEQVVAYAEARGCREAVLVYPFGPEEGLEASVGRIRARTLTFPPGADIERSGPRFIEELLVQLAPGFSRAPGHRLSGGESDHTQAQ